MYYIQIQLGPDTDLAIGKLNNKETKGDYFWSEKIFYGFLIWFWTKNIFFKDEYDDYDDYDDEDSVVYGMKNIFVQLNMMITMIMMMRIVQCTG